VKAHECGVHQGQSELDATGTFNEALVPAYFRILRDLYGDELGNQERAWLDIGSGHGEFLMALRQFSKGRVSPRGLEPNRHKRRSSSNRGLQVSYFDLRSHQERYDVLSLLNVYSHLPDPPQFLLLCKSLLKPGGELLLETGDTANLPPEEHYRPFYLPDHLSFASEQIGSGILHRCGFQVVSLRKYPFVPFKSNLIQWLKEVVKLVWPGKQSQLRTLIGERRRNRKYVTDMYIRAKQSGGSRHFPDCSA
jgi:SAM-dependent methyltransferase